MRGTNNSSNNSSSKTSSGSKFFIPTAILKLFFLLILFVGVPYAMAALFKKYESKATGIVGQQTDLIDAFSDTDSRDFSNSNFLGAASVQDETGATGTNRRAGGVGPKVLSHVEAETLQKISEFIQGEWVSGQDGRYRMSIEPNNRFNEYYDNIKEGYGIWKLYSSVKVSAESESGFGATSTKQTDRQTESSEPEYEYFFQKEQYEPNHKGEIYRYNIQQLDDQQFVLIYTAGTGKPLIFKKASDLGVSFDSAATTSPTTSAK